MEFDQEQLEEGRRLFASPARFLLSVTRLQDLPEPVGVEIAIAGRSNVGKSSLLNGLTGQTGLARASNMPGRTQALNFFDIGDGAISLVDMPGYGYAKAAKADVKKWQDLLKAYLRRRASLRRVFVLIDSRHGILAVDKSMFKLLDEAAVPYQLVLTKSDKIKAPALQDVLVACEHYVKKCPAALTMVLSTSAQKNQGLAELRAMIFTVLSAH